MLFQILIDMMDRWMQTKGWNSVTLWSTKQNWSYGCPIRCWKGPISSYYFTSEKYNPCCFHLFFDLCSWCFIRWKNYSKKIGPEPKNKGYKFSGTIWYHYPGVEKVHKTKGMLNKTDVKFIESTGQTILSILGQSHWHTHSFKIYNITHHKAKKLHAHQSSMFYCKWFRCFFVPFFTME